MENNKTILICLNYFQIGGVETFVYNQTKALLKKGYNVVVLGKDDIYSDMFKKTGAKCINFEFENKNYYDYEKIEAFIKILRDNNVTEVHNNSFQSMNVVVPACLITNTPYIAYSHMSESVIEDELNFFEEHYETYKDNIEMYFRFANKIMSITPKTKKFIEEKYNITDNDKVSFIRNSIDFEEFKAKRMPKEIKRILIISRLEELKKKSVIEGIKLYGELYKKNHNLELRIAGDGSARKEIEEYVESNKLKNVIFLGAISNVKEEMERSDAVIGVARCILEAIAMKRIAIISSYTGMRDILSKDNFEIEINDNFSGRNLEKSKILDIANKVSKLDSDSIKEIIEYNYKQAINKLDINNNIYTVTNPEKCNYSSNYEVILDYMIKVNDTLGKLAEYRFEKMENDWKDHLKYKEWMESQVEQIKEDSKKEIEKLTNEIRMYENSKPIRYSNRLKRLLGMKGNKK